MKKDENRNMENVVEFSVITDKIIEIMVKIIKDLLKITHFFRKNKRMR